MCLGIFVINVINHCNLVIQSACEIVSEMDGMEMFCFYSRMGDKNKCLDPILRMVINLKHLKFKFSLTRKFILEYKS